MENLALLEYACVYHSDGLTTTLSPQFTRCIQQLQKHSTVHVVTGCVIVSSAFLPLYTANVALALQREDTGSSVTTLQRQLTAAGFYNGPITEYYGEMTEAAVVRFQRANGLVTDGIAGPATLSVLEGSSSITTSPSSVGRPSNGVLRRESSGPAVATLQDQLRAAGVFSGTSTGYFGSHTEAAVLQFQRSQGLTADGIAGAATLVALRRRGESSSQFTNSMPAETSLRRESNGPRVKQLQEQLKAAGFFQGNTTEYFGSQTEQAVIAFQTSRGLTPDGIVGSATTAALNRSSGVIQQGTPASTGGSTGGSSPTRLQRESSGSAVTQLQERLKTLGYFEGEATGFFGPLTESAVIAFQTAQSLAPDGIVGAATLSALDTATVSGSRTAANDGILRPSQEIQVGVETLQRKLRDIGYYSGALDGVYGSGTEEAVRRFQRDRGLTSDGIAGPITLTALDTEADRITIEGNTFDLSIGLPPQPTSEVLRPTPTPSIEVMMLQEQLRALGYYSEAIDGIYGAQTQTAVMRFQRINGLIPDGFVGDQTKQALRQSIGSAATEVNNPPFTSEQLIREAFEEYSRLRSEHRARNPNSMPFQHELYAIQNMRPEIRNRFLSIAGRQSLETFARVNSQARWLLNAIEIWENTFQTS